MSAANVSTHAAALAVSELARRALAEDAPAGDLTSELVVPARTRCRAELRAQQVGVVAGIEAVEAVFAIAVEQDGDEALVVEPGVVDGATVRPGDVLATVRGRARTLLRAERIAVNLLSHLSGIATLTRRYVEAAAPAQVLCTRKTLPGLRALEREAVVAGGGGLHRASLSEAVLIKDNHIRIAGGVGEAVRRAKRVGSAVEIEVEVETLEELNEARSAGADRILLDNPTPELVRAAVGRVGDAERLEVSGGVRLETIGDLVAAGARVLSVGRLTHSAPALDISMEVVGVDEDARP